MSDYDEWKTTEPDYWDGDDDDDFEDAPGLRLEDQHHECDCDFEENEPWHSADCASRRLRQSRPPKETDTP